MNQFVKEHERTIIYLKTKQFIIYYDLNLDLCLSSKELQQLENVNINEYLTNGRYL